jgi:hyperosmotically inducible periplasmic protein
VKAAGARAASGAVLAVLCGLLLMPRVADAWTSDSWITTRLKIALFTTLGWSASEISVGTVDGRVTLYGKVPSAAEKAKAVEVARSIDGVSAVRDFLEVKTRREPRPRSDASIRTHVEKAFEKDGKWGGGGVSVASVKNGVVRLSGKAPSSVALLRAIEVARRVRGVRRVESQVEIAADTGDLDVWNRHELRQDGRGILDVATDLWITAETRFRLLADPRLPSLDVNVDCRDQEITLFGTVGSKAEKKAAEEDASSVPGVREVENELQVVPESLRPAVEAKDTDLQAKVTEAIYSRPEMKRAAVRVAVSDGVVRLTGTAPSQQHRLFAATAARSVAGVRAVKEEMEVTSITEERAPDTPAPAK